MPLSGMLSTMTLAIMTLGKSILSAMKFGTLTLSITILLSIITLGIMATGMTLGIMTLSITIKKRPSA
jgi:hypothetical protein